MISVGFDPTAWYTAEEFAQQGKGSAKLGSIIWTDEGKAYVCVQLGTDGVTGDGYVCVIDEDFEAVMLSTDNDADGDQVGVAEGAGAAGEFGWLQVYGKAGIRTSASALANTKLIPTATDGQVDDGVAVGFVVAGMWLRTATGGAAAVNDSGFLTWPRVEIMMEPETA